MIFNSIVSKRKIVKPCDFSNLIKTIGKGESWKATKDCWMAFSFGSSSSTNKVYVNEVLVYSTYDAVSIPPSIYIRKGDTIKFTDGSTTSDVYFYGCIE